MAKRRKKPPGQDEPQAGDERGALIFEHGIYGDLDMSVSCRRVGTTTVITALHGDGVMQFTVTDEEREVALTPGQRLVRDSRRGEGGVSNAN